MKFKDWVPPLGIRAAWLQPTQYTELESILGAALDALVSHDNAAAIREKREGCVELQHAKRVLAAVLESDKLFPKNPLSD